MIVEKLTVECFTIVVQLFIRILQLTAVKRLGFKQIKRERVGHGLNGLPLTYKGCLPNTI